MILVTETDTDLKDFEERLPNDSSIEDYESLSDFGERILIQITLSEEGFKSMTYPVAVNLDIIFLDVEARDERIQYRAQVPSLEDLSHYCEYCSDRGLDFRLKNISQKRSFQESDTG